MQRRSSLPAVTIGHFRRAPIRVYVTVIPVLAFVAATNRGVAGWLGSFLGFVAIILAHELGHAAIGTRYGMRLEAIELHGFGGECLLTGEISRAQAIALAWGGVLGQAALFLVPDALHLLGVVPTTVFGRTLMAMLHGPNVALMAFNLLPVGRLDGATAWKVIPYAAKRLASRTRPSRQRRPTERRSRPKSM